MPEEIHALGRVGQRLDARRDRVREEADPVDDAGAGRPVAPPVPEEVEREDAAAAREERKRERPLSPVGADSMQEDERRRAARPRRAGVEARDRQALSGRQAAELQYFLMSPTTTPWTFTSPSAA